MRKDVRFGLAVGGLLVVVMAVYLVIAGTSKHNASSDQVHLVTSDGTEAPANTPDTAAGKGEAGTPPVTAEKTPSPTDPAPDLFANGAGAKGTDHAQHNPAPDNHAPAAGGSSHGDVWATLLANGPSPALAMTETPTPGAADANANQATPAAQVTPAPAPAGASATILNDTGSDAAPDTGSLNRSDSRTTQIAGTSPTRPAGQLSHRVQSGETFSTIALQTYGSTSYWPHIARANPQINPKHLKVGMVLTLPDPAEVKAGARHDDASGAHADTQSIDAARQYRVQANDSLYKISLRLYGKSDRVDKLYQLNRQAIGPNPAHLKLGMILTLPEAPTQSAATH